MYMLVARLPGMPSASISGHQGPCFPPQSICLLDGISKWICRYPATWMPAILAGWERRQVRNLESGPTQLTSRVESSARYLSCSAQKIRHLAILINLRPRVRTCDLVCHERRKALVLFSPSLCANRLVHEYQRHHSIGALTSHCFHSTREIKSRNPCLGEFVRTVRIVVISQGLFVLFGQKDKSEDLETNATSKEK